MGALYRLTFADGRCYIGATERTAEQAYAAHKANAEKGDGNWPLAKAWRKLGAPKLDVLAYATGETLKRELSETIDRLQTIYPKGYNAWKDNQIAPGARKALRAERLAEKAGPTEAERIAARRAAYVARHG